MKLYRRLAGRARSALRQERPIVLMYHRVERRSVDPWQLAVSPERFARHIELLAASRTVVPLSWLAKQLACGRLPRHTATVTFDDGYADVFRNALPVLEAAACPATVFVATGAVGSGAGFWWDVLARIVLEASGLPEALEVELGGKMHRVVASPTDRGRAAALMTLHALLRPAHPEARTAAIARIAACAGTDAAARPGDLAMTAEQVARIAANPLIEIGAHTVTHPPLTSRSGSEQIFEVSESRCRCEEIIGRPVSSFAYPYGDFDRSAIAAVRAAGLLSACTTVGRAVRRGDDSFAIPRVLAADWGTGEFRSQVLAHG